MIKEKQVISSIQLSEQQLKKLIAVVAKKKHVQTIRQYYGQNNLLSLKNTHNNNLPQKKNNEIDDLDIDDFLKTVSHQKKILSKEKVQKLRHIHQNSQIQHMNYKYFLMVVSQANYKKLYHPGYYKELLKYKKDYPDYFFSCIQKDIPRTLQNGHPFQEALRNILCAYGIRNPSLLYCQGMNYIVCFLLINGFSEEEGFWFLTTIIEDVVMPDYFKDLSTISITSQIFDDLLQQIFPELAEQMNEVGMESSIFLITWYICLFTKGFINSVSEYLLQEIILQSKQYCISYILIKLSIGVITTMFIGYNFEYEKDFQSLKDTIQQKVQQISLDEIKTGLSYFELDYEVFLKIYKFYKDKRQNLFQKALNKELNEKKLALPSCSPQYPVCLQRIEIEKKIGSIEEVLILKNDLNIRQQYQENYFPKNVNRGPGIINYTDPKQCPIIHHNHVCETQKKIIKPTTKLAVQKSVYKPVNECESSVELESRFSKIEDKYNEFSQFFVIDEVQYTDDIDISFQQQISLTESVQIKAKNENNFVNSIGNAFKKALRGINLLRSKQEIQDQ